MDVAEARRLKAPESENERLKRLIAEQLLVIDVLKEFSPKNNHREALEVLIRRGLTQHTACRYLGLNRRVPAYKPKQPEQDRPQGEQLIAASQEMPSFGYRRILVWLSLGKSRVRRPRRAMTLSIPRQRPCR